MYAHRFEHLGCVQPHGRIRVKGRLVIESKEPLGIGGDFEKPAWDKRNGQAWGIADQFTPTD
jgi:hypothetical protein